MLSKAFFKKVKTTAALITITAACAPTVLAKQGNPTTELTIATYNLENLFDTSHDPKKNDFSFLPLRLKQLDPKHRERCLRIRSKKYRKQCLELDWSEKALGEKIDQIVTSFSQAFPGSGPDISIFTEVENAAILDRLVSAMPYTDLTNRVLLEDSDPRGIDIAVVSRFPLAGKPQIAKPKKKTARKSLVRGILQVPLQLPSGETVTVLGVHFPAAYHPRKKRVFGLELLRDLAAKASSQGHWVIAAGDFNITAKEGPFLYRGMLAQDFSISHLEGCKTCLGTYYYRPKDSWSFLDAILLHHGANGSGCVFEGPTIRTGPPNPRASDHLWISAKARCR